MLDKKHGQSTVPSSHQRGARATWGICPRLCHIQELWQSGYLNRKEFKKTYNEVATGSSQERKHMFNEVDANHTGRISEFVEYYIYHSKCGTWTQRRTPCQRGCTIWIHWPICTNRGCATRPTWTKRTLVDTIRSQKDNTNMQLQPSCAITTPTPCSSCPMGADVYSQSSCSRWKQIFYEVDTGLNQWMWILWILRIHLPQSPTTRTLSGIWDNTPLPGLDSYMDGTITQVHMTTSNRSCSPLKWKSVAPL